MAGNRQSLPETILGLRPGGPDRRRSAQIGADRAAMLALPPVPPPTGWEMSPRDHYVRLDSNDYSVPPTAIGRRVLIRADLDAFR
jgi:hypothetical protein